VGTKVKVDMPWLLKGLTLPTLNKN
jgi:hypothetical protein